MRDVSDPEGRNLPGLERLFSNVRSYRLEFERAHTKLKGMAGTLLAVQAGSIRGQAEIVTHDWVTGAPVSRNLSVYADGTDAVCFNQIAHNEFQPLQSLPSPDLGAWAVNCVEAELADEGMIGVVRWPVDLSIIRRDHGCWIHVSQRIEAASTARHPAFDLQNG